MVSVPGSVPGRVNLSQFIVRLNPSLSGGGLKNCSRTVNIGLPVLDDVCFTTGHAVCSAALGLANFHLPSPRASSGRRVPRQEGGFHLTLPSPVPTGPGHSGKAVHHAGKQFRKNKYPHLLWTKIGSPGLWEELSVIANGRAWWHLAPHVRRRPSRQCPDSSDKGRQGQEP